MPYHAAEQTTELGIERQCRYCGEFWPLDFFERSPRCKYGRTLECNACRKERRTAPVVEATRRKRARSAACSSRKADRSRTTEQRASG